MLIDEATSGVGTELLECRLDLGAAHIEIGHLREIERDAVLTHLTADWDHLRNAGNGQQPRADDPIDQLSNLHRTSGIAGDRDQHNLTHDGGDRRHLRVHVTRQLLAHHAQPFGHLLPVEEEVGAPVELDINDGKAHPRNRSDAHDARHTVHGGLERKRHKLLDLLRSKAIRLGNEGHNGAIEVGEHIDRQIAQRYCPVNHKKQGSPEHEQSVAQARRDQKVEHVGRPDD